MSNQIDTNIKLNYTLRNDHDIPLQKTSDEPDNIRAFRIFLSVLRANSDHGNQRAEEAYQRCCNYLGEHSKNLPILVAEFIGTNYFKIICREFEIKKQTCYTSCAPTPHEEEDRKFLVWNSKGATPNLAPNSLVYNSNLATPHYNDKRSCTPNRQVYNSNLASKSQSQSQSRSSQPITQPQTRQSSQSQTRQSSRPASRSPSSQSSRYATPRGTFTPKHPAFARPLSTIDEKSNRDSSEEPSIEELEENFDHLSTNNPDSAELEIAHKQLQHRRDDEKFRQEQAARELQLYGRNKPCNAETSPSRSEPNIGIAPIKMEMPRSFTSITVVDQRQGKASNIFTTETKRLGKVELDGMSVHFK